MNRYKCVVTDVQATAAAAAHPDGAYVKWTDHVAEVEAWRRNTREECEKSTILEARLASVTASLDDAIDGWKSAQAIMSAAERDAERWREFVKRSPLIAASCVAALDAARAGGAQGERSHE